MVKFKNYVSSFGIFSKASKTVYAQITFGPQIRTCTYVRNKGPAASTYIHVHERCEIQKLSLAYSENHDSGAIHRS